MNTQTTFTGSPDDLRKMLEAVITPLVDRISMLEDKVLQTKDILSVGDVAELASVSESVVRTWIRHGRPLPGANHTIKLRRIEGLSDGPFKVSREAWLEFRSAFRDVIHMDPPPVKLPQVA